MSSGFIQAFATAMPEAFSRGFMKNFEAVAYHEATGTVVKNALRIQAIDKE